MSGIQRVTFDKSGLETPVAASADGVANPTSQVAQAVESVFNGTTWDRKRGNIETGSVVTVTTGSVNGPDQTNYNNRGLILVIDITAITGTSITFTVQGKDPTSGKYYTILASAALTGTGTTVLRVFPGSTVTANLAANDTLPRTWRVITTAVALTVMTATVAGIVVA